MVKVEDNICLWCGGCTAVCPHQALELEGRLLKVDQDKCVECGLCVKFCPVGAIKGERE